MKKPIAKLAVSASNRVIWVDRPNKPQRARGTMCSTADSRDLRIEGRKRKTGLELWWGVANLPTYTPLGVGLGSMDQSMGWDGMAWDGMAWRMKRNVPCREASAMTLVHCV
ncbi:hypothetical protein CTAM01_06658 [Colletotrichum tamarilloi]|uniref:Uncharacterized protein n=1 Tax=Colletotrichum tamarilloi TaxID=1209934 RepID=A0ABQ9RBE7_9PEZI|nr:uncharacterized protein CTAM01_06658 [Colletotrichum tamarilloi]KAK1500059.1 hypothetical protein CTAM01_06658 [Colletotrichum tamarilloi]